MPQNLINLLRKLDLKKIKSAKTKLNRKKPILFLSSEIKRCFKSVINN